MKKKIELLYFGLASFSISAITGYSATLSDSGFSFWLGGVSAITLLSAVVFVGAYFADEDKSDY